MIKRIRRSFICAAAVMALSLSSSAQVNDKPDPVLQENYTVTIADVPLDLNPQTATYSTEAQVLNGIFEGLYSYDPKTLEPVPALAEDCRISRDKKRWTFTIRSEAKFSTGEAITAYTVKSSWLSLLKTPDAPYASLLDCIVNAQKYRAGEVTEDEVGIKAKDDRTLIVTLSSPTAHFARLLCHHSFSVVSSDKNAYSGAFAVSSVEKGRIILTRNEHYWDRENVPLEKITINQSNDAEANTWSFNEDETDWIYSVLDVRTLINESSKHIGTVFGTEYLFFTCRKSPWDKPDFRNALLTAVPWAELRKSLIMPASTLIYPLSGYPVVEGLNYTDIDYAKELLSEARKKAGISEDEKLTLTFGISDSQRMKEQAQLLKDAWEQLGVELIIQKTTDVRYLSFIDPSNADLFSYSWIGDFADPLAFLELFRHDSTLNETKWYNQEYEKLLNESSYTSDSTERFRLLGKAELTLLDDGEIIPISHSISVHAINLKSTGGWYANALDIHPFKYLYKKQNEEKPQSQIYTVVKYQQ